VNRILQKRVLTPNTTLFVIEAPRIARAFKAGQFVILRPTLESERIPLTIVDAEPLQGSITLVVQAAGKTTSVMASLGMGDSVADVLGPLGEPTRVEQIGHILCVAGGVGLATLVPVARAMGAVGNEVTALCGGKSADFLVLREEIEGAAQRVLWATEDGSVGLRGNVVDLMRAWIRSQPAPPALVQVAGPVRMMQAVAAETLLWPARTIASLNPIMVDGIGMCGGCRVTVGGCARFACVEGPEFDAHQVDFEELARRNRTYAKQEQEAMRAYECALEQHAMKGEFRRQ
jgi:ferredoxin--NADP+ reductase